MSLTLKITIDEKGKSVDQHEYRSMISVLLYLTASRPNITFSVGVCARDQADPKDSNKKAIKHILRYVNGISQHGIFYRNYSTTHLVGYSDAD